MISNIIYTILIFKLKVITTLIHFILYSLSFIWANRHSVTFHHLTFTLLSGHLNDTERGHVIITTDTVSQLVSVSQLVQRKSLAVIDLAPFRDAKSVFPYIRLAKSWSSSISQFHIQHWQEVKYMECRGPQPEPVTFNHTVKMWFFKVN